MKRSVTYSFTVAFLLRGIVSAETPGQWTAVTNSHFEIYSQTGGEALQNALLWFERLRTLFVQGGFLQEIARPGEMPVLRVIGFRSPQEYEPFRIRSGADAYYTGSNHRDYIVMPSLAPRYFAMAAHEYAHFALHSGGLKIPDWLGEGIAEYFSTVRFVNGGYELGGDVPARSQTLQRKSWIPLTGLFDFKVELAVRQTRQDVAPFYAESWALTDMLMTSPEYRAHLAELVAALNSGTSSSDAFRKIYGKPMDVVSQDLTHWFAHKRKTVVVQTNLPEPAAISTVALSDRQSTVVLADLLVATGNVDRARVQFAEMSRQAPHDAEIHAALGSIAFGKGEREEAVREWRNALDDGLKDADLCFRYALAAEEMGAPLSDIRAALLRGIALRPSFEDARFRLALLESNAGNYGAAIDQLQSLPVPHGLRAFDYWATLAYALTELDRREEAMAAAGKALSEATTEEGRARAKRLAYFASTDVQTQFVRDSDGRLQMATTRVESGNSAFNPFVEPSDRMRRSKGALTEVLCNAGTLTGFRVLTADGPLMLSVPDPLHVLIESGPKEWFCGVVQENAVRVDYAVVEANGEEKKILRGMMFEGGATR